MVKMILGILILMMSVGVYATDMTGDFSDGNPLTAAELNNWKDERVGHVYPINPSSNNYEVSGNYDIGSSSYRWRNGNFAGIVRADAQPQVRVYQSSTDDIGDSYATINWQAESYDTQTMWTSPNAYIVIPESGTYLMYTTIYIEDIADIQVAAFYVKFVLNSTTDLAENVMNFGNDLSSNTAFDIQQLSQNDQISVEAMTDSAVGDPDTVAGTEKTYMTVVKLF